MSGDYINHIIGEDKVLKAVVVLACIGVIAVVVGIVVVIYHILK